MIVIVVINSTPFLHSLLTKGKFCEQQIFSVLLRRALKSGVRIALF